MSTKFFEHPDFADSKDDWRKFSDLCAGNHKTLVKPEYLWMHEFEGDVAKGGKKSRKIRENRTRYINRAKSILNRYVSLTFQEEINITDKIKDLFGADIADVDGDGSDLITFLKNNIALPLFRDGKVIVSVDAPANSATTKEEEKTLGVRPYLLSWEALHLPDWNCLYIGERSLNKYDQLRLQFKEILPRESLTEAPAQVEITKTFKLLADAVQVKTYTQTSQNANNKDWKMKAETEIPAYNNKLPVLVIEAGNLMREWADLLLKIYNKESSLDNQLNAQALQRTFLSGNFDANSEITINEGAIALIPKEATLTTVEPSNPVALINSIASDLMNLIQIAFYRTRPVPAESKNIEGAETLRETKEEFIEVLKKVGKDIETGINNLINIYAFVKTGNENFESDLKFNLDLTIEDKDFLMNLFSMIKPDVEKVPAWYRACMVKFLSYFNFDRDVYNEVLQEIDTLEVVPEEPTQLNRADIFAL